MKVSLGVPVGAALALSITTLAPAPVARADSLDDFFDPAHWSVFLTDSPIASAAAPDGIFATLHESLYLAPHAQLEAFIHNPANAGLLDLLNSPVVALLGRPLIGDGLDGLTLGNASINGTAGGILFGDGGDGVFGGDGGAAGIFGNGGDGGDGVAAHFADGVFVAATAGGAGGAGGALFGDGGNGGDGGAGWPGGLDQVATSGADGGAGGDAGALLGLAGHGGAGGVGGLGGVDDGADGAPGRPSIGEGLANLGGGTGGTPDGGESRADIQINQMIHGVTEADRYGAYMDRYQDYFDSRAGQLPPDFATNQTVDFTGWFQVSLANYLDNYIRTLSELYAEKYGAEVGQWVATFMRLELDTFSHQFWSTLDKQDGLPTKAWLDEFVRSYTTDTSYVQKFLDFNSTNAVPNITDPVQMQTFLGDWYGDAPMIRLMPMAFAGQVEQAIANLYAAGEPQAYVYLADNPVSQLMDWVTAPVRTVLINFDTAIRDADQSILDGTTATSNNPIIVVMRYFFGSYLDGAK